MGRLPRNSHRQISALMYCIPLKILEEKQETEGLVLTKIQTELTCSTIIQELIRIQIDLLIRKLVHIIYVHTLYFCLAAHCMASYRK